MKPDLGFPSERRLQCSADFKRVFSDPLRSRSRYFTVLARPNQGESPRLGVTVAKRKIALAVNRNRLKRLIREQFRLHQATLGGLDWVIIVQADAHDPAARQLLYTDLQQQWRRLVTAWKNCS